MAVLVATVAYSTYVSSHRPPVPTARAPAIAEPPAPPRVQGLPPMEPPGRWISAALTRGGVVRRPGVASIDVTGVPGAAGGLGVLDGESMAVLAWIDRPADAAPERLDVPGIPEGDHWLVAARSPALARFSYLSRTRLPMADDGGEVRGTAAIDPTSHRFTLDLEWPGLESAAPPLVGTVLRRVDDADWRYRPPGSLSEDFYRKNDGHRLLAFEGLGAGEYELTLEGATPVPDDEPRLRITLPGPQVITIRCSKP